MNLKTRLAIDLVAMAGMFWGIYMQFTLGWALMVVCGSVTVFSAIGYLRSDMNARDTTTATRRT